MAARASTESQRNGRLNFGRNLVVAYFVLYYLFPLVGDRLFGDRIFSIYEYAPFTWVTSVLLIGTLVSFLVLMKLPRIRIVPRFLSWRAFTITKIIGSLYTQQRLLIALASLALSVPYIASGLNSYRYSSLSISETDSLFGIAMIVLRLVVSVDIFFCMFLRPRERLSILSKRYIGNVLLSLMLVATANGTASMLMALISMGYALFPGMFYTNVFMRPGASVVTRVRRASITIGLALAVFGVSWVAGETIKMSSSARSAGLANAWESLMRFIVRSPDLVANYGFYVISGMSTHYYALLFTTHPTKDLTGGEISAVLHPLQNLAFRVDYLTGRFIDLPRPRYGSLSRLNYSILTVERQVGERQGTSPGLIASFNYVFAFPFNILFCAVYLVWVARLTNRLLASHSNESLSLAGLVLLLLYMRVLFESPFDQLIVFDDAFIFAALLVGGAALAQHAAQAAAESEPAPLPLPPKLVST